MDPERVLPVCAIVLGLAIGGGFIASTAAVQGCASEQCVVPAGVELPVSVLECPSGTLCYQGACINSCASGAEGKEKCESDSDCPNGVRPNCVDRRCSSCGEGQRCVPALNICSTVRGNNTGDAGTIIGDSGFVPGVSPLDGGTIDGSVLRFDTGINEMPMTRPITHIGRIEIRQRNDLVRSTLTSTIIVDIKDIRGTNRVISSTIPISIVADNQVCEITLKDTFRSTPERVNMGDVQIEPITASPGINGANYRATFNNGNYRVRPTIPSALLIYSEMMPRFLKVFGEGAEDINDGSWPPGDPDLIEVPEKLELAPTTRALLQSTIDTRVYANFVLSWNRSYLHRDFGEVHLRVETSKCILLCVAQERFAKLEFSPELAPTMRGTYCEASGPYPMTVDRVLSRKLNAKSDAPALVDLSVSVKDGFVSRITF